MIDGSLLALDVGGGTQDLFLWEPGQTVENAVKMVMPAPTQIVGRRIERLTEAGRPVFLQGRLMGGGAISRAVGQHLQRGLPVYATPQAALTLSDRLERVQSWGVVLSDTPPDGAVPLTLGDVDLEGLSGLLAAFEVPWPRHFAVAVQDHGFAPQESNRRFRFRYWEEVLVKGGKLQDQAFHQPPEIFTRMRAVAETVPGVLLMDTCAAGVRGALLEPQAREYLASGLLVVNLGNAHTFAALVREERLFGIYEHHTGLLDRARLFNHLRRFQAGEISNDEVFADQGHGCAYAPEYAALKPFTFTVMTGPRRRLARGWPGVFAAPLGDMMLTGCFGLLTAFLEMEQIPVSLAEF